MAWNGLARAARFALASAVAAAAAARAQTPIDAPPPPEREPAGTALAGPPFEAAATDPLARRALPPFVPSYRDFAAARSWLEACAAAVPDVARVVDIALAFDGRPVPAIEIAAPGTLAPDARTTVLVIGGLDGQSLAGAEAALATVHAALTDPGQLASDVALVVVPWPAPEALEARLTGALCDGRNPRPFDDDRDGKTDEDGPDDLNDDGLVLDMLIEDEGGSWVLAADRRFLARARPGDWPRYRRTREGRDDDGDGRFNEDAAGGVVLDRSFPLHRTGAWDDPCAGALPLVEPVARACADLALQRRVGIAVLLQGNHGGLALPGGVAAADAAVARDRAAYERVAAMLEQRTGRRRCEGVPLREAWGQPRPGAALDWLAEVAGALAFEVAPWGPRLDAGSDAAPRDARYGEANGSALRPPLDERSREWARWLDNVRGGLGFVDWAPIDLGPARALVGGFEPWTVDNPPRESLAPAIAGLGELVLDLAASLPRLELRAQPPARDGDVCVVRARVANSGALPTSLASSARYGDGAIEVEVELSEGARLIAGDARRWLPRLGGGESSAEVAWIVLAPAGSTLTLRASAPWCSPVAREVRL
jgi:hypothetical protein